MDVRLLEKRGVFDSGALDIGLKGYDRFTGVKRFEEMPRWKMAAHLTPRAVLWRWSIRDIPM